LDDVDIIGIIGLWVMNNPDLLVWERWETTKFDNSEYLLSSEPQKNRNKLALTNG